jgi:ABC-type glycerol-3-phosphate transport system substrate-binding protein
MKKKSKIIIGIVIIIATIVAIIGIGLYTFLKPAVTLNVVAEPFPATDCMKQYLSDFEKETGIKVNWIYLPELERRSKVRLDLSSGAGEYQIVTTDLMWIPELVEGGWLLPLDEYLDSEFVKDMVPEVLDTVTYKGKIYALPVGYESIILMIRKDLFDAEGIKYPETMEELLTAAKHFYKPPEMYGIAIRGLRGEGMNVYIWSSFLAAFGGKFLEDRTPVFNSPEAIKATEFYKELTKYGPPGIETFSWAEVEDLYRAGRVAMIIDATDFPTRLEDPSKSTVVGKTEYLLPPAGPAGRFGVPYSYAFSISKVGCKTDDQIKAAVRLLTWLLSKEMGFRRIKEFHDVDANYLKSLVESNEYKETFGKWGRYVETMKELPKYSPPDIRPRIVEWPEFGDYLGIKLEEILAGTVDVKTGLDDAVSYAKKVLGG